MQNIFSPFIQKTIKTIIVFFITIAAENTSAALVFNAPTHDSDGNFSLSWSGFDAHILLHEKVNGVWQTRWGSSQMASYEVTGKAVGTYEYKLENYCRNERTSPTVCESIIKTVIVGPVIPTISAIGDVTINEDTSKTISFTASGEGQLVVTASSSNNAVISSSGLVLSGAGAERYIKVVPQANKSGSATITLTISDGSKSSSRTFTVTVLAVNDAPNITPINNFSINEGTLNSGNISFIIDDIDSPVGNLTISSSSSNTTLVKNTDIIIIGSGASRSLVITPTVRATGSSIITLSVSDGALTSSISFTFSVIDLPPSLFISTTNSSTGNFSLSWDYAKETVKITESKDGGVDYPLPGYTVELPPKLSIDVNKNVNGSYKYTLHECLHGGNQGGSYTTCTAKDSKTIVVSLPKPTLSASLNATVINEGGNVTLTWSSTNSDSCSATNISGVSSTSGIATYTATSILSTNQIINFVVTCVGGGGAVSKTLNLTVNAINDAPELSLSNNISADEDTAIYIPFTVNDEETAISNLVWSFLSNRQSIIANTGIRIDHINKRLIVTPIENANGNVALTVRVTDTDGAYVEKIISINISAVNDAPIISDLTSLTTIQDTPIGQSFTVNDVDGTPESQLIVTASVTSGDLLLSSLEVLHDGAQRKIIITPHATYSGVSTIKIDVTDGIAISSKSFTITVNNVNTTLSVENNNGRGNYTITWKYGDMPVRVTESRNGGAELNLYGSYTSPSGSKNFSKNQDGNYIYKVYDCTAGQGGVACNSLAKTVQVDVVLPIPSTPSITTSSTTSETGEFTVSWTAVDGVNYYELYENDWLVADVIGLTTSKSYSSELGTAKNTGKYSYKVKACNASGCSPLSKESIVSVAKPSKIVSVFLTLNVTTGIPILKWSIPVPASLYEIQQQLNDGSWTDNVTKITNPSTLEAVHSAGTYKYQVRACDVVGAYKVCSDWISSNSAGIYLPNVPIASANKINTTGNISFGWTTVPNTLNYLIKENGSIFENRVDSTSFSITKPNGTYTYQIAACNAAGCGDFSNAIKVDVAKIETLRSVTATLNQFTGIPELSWPTTGGATIYKIQAQLNGENQGGIVSTNNTAYTFSPVSEKGDYRYQVTACAVIGENSNCATPVLSNVVTPLVPTTAPIINAPLNSSTGTYTIKWSAITGANRYELYENDIKITSTNNLSYTYTTASAKNSGKYTYTIKACNALCGPLSNSARVNVERSSSSSATNSSTGVALLDQLVFDPLNDSLDGDQYLGSLRGNHSVGNDGSFNYILPIEIPPGINNAQPKLALNYNSNQKNGLVGWGWSLSGLSIISRCGASLVRDGYVSGIQNNDNYRYCLDGQRLVEVAVNQYRTENESFLYIEKKNHYWEITDTKGTVSRFGYNTDSFMADDQNESYIWHLDKVSDVANNYWTVTYAKDGAIGTHYPNQINYTKSTLTGTDYSITFTYEDRDDLSTKYIAGSKLTINKRLKKIDVKSYGNSIRTYTLDYQQIGTTYSGKKYEDPTRTSRLNSISLCYSSSYCVSPIVFNWTSREIADFKLGITDNPDISHYAQTTTLNSPLRLLLDINGDGKLEPYIGESRISETQADGSIKYYTPSYKKADINRDGFDDVIKAGQGAGVGIQIFLSDGNAISQTPSLSYEIPISEIRYTYTKLTTYKVGVPDWVVAPKVDPSAYILQYVDMNSDGLLDVIRSPGNCVSGFVRCVVEGAPTDISVALNNGSGFDPFEVWLPNWNTNLLLSIGVHLHPEWFSLSFADYNGDGLLDFIATSAFGANRAVVGINKGSNFTVRLISNSNNRFTFVGDFNGDGKVDLLNKRAELHGNNQDIKYCGEQRYVNTGQRKELDDPSGILNDDYHPDQCFSAVIDYNGDGLDDIVKWGKRSEKIYSENTHELEGYVYLSKGLDSNGMNTFAAPIKYRDTELWRNAKSKFNMGLNSPTFEFADYHAKGTMGDSPYLQNNLQPNVITGVVTEAQSIDIQYSALSSDKVYSYIPENVSSDEQSGEVLTPRATARRNGVSEIEVSNGVGGKNITTYSYSTAKRNTMGYGELGFAEITKIDTIEGHTPLKTVINFHHDANSQFNLAGKIKRQRLYTANHDGTSLQMLADTRYQWKVRLYNDDIDNQFTSPHYFNYLYRSSNRVWDLDGSEVSTSLTQNHSHISPSCTELDEAPAILITNQGSSDDSDYHSDGVLLYSETSTCDHSNSSASVQISAKENSNIITAGNVRGLSQTVRTSAWVGSSISLADRNLYSNRTLGFTYNNLGQLESKTTEPNTSSQSQLRFTSTYTYNGYGTVDSITDTWDSSSNNGLDVSSRITQITEAIDNSGYRTVSKTNGLGLRESTVYEPLWGKAHRQTDENGLQTITHYDELGRLRLVAYTDGTKTNYDYHACVANDLPSSNNCVWYLQSKTTGSSAERTYYDSLDRTVGTRKTGLNGQAIYSLQTYTSHGAISQSTAPFFYGGIQQVTTTSYDTLGRVSNITHPDGSIQRYNYYGLRHTTTNRLNQVQTRYLNAAGWVMRSLDNANTPVDFTYGAFGELMTTQVNNDMRTIVSINYDRLGRKTEMTDPNIGKIMFTYNALDLVATQTDAKNQRTCFGYDALGRQVKRVDNATSSCTGTTQSWAYDTKPNGKAQLSSMSGFNTDGSSYSEQYTYNSYGLPETTSSSFGGVSYLVKQHYDLFSRPLGVTYPTGYLAANSYNNYGHLEHIKDSTGQTLWTANDTDALGNIKEFTLGNGIITTKTYNDDTNIIESIRAVSGDLIIQDQHYTFDALGNLRSREDRKHNVTQDFCYDNLNRLKAANFNGCSGSATDYSYDPLGNLTSKLGINGTLSYGTIGGNISRPHAVTSANGWVYEYDKAGNLEKATKAGEQTRTVSYSPFNTPTSINQGTKFSTLVYGPNQDRIKHSDSNGRVTKYVGGIYEEVTAGGVTQKIHYVGDFSLFIQTGGASPISKHEYLHRDHIGSIIAISQSAVSTINDIDWKANGAWGERRFQQWDGPQDDSIIPTSTARGFTDHEHLDAVGLIHMNGRVYDPELGRFMSADPFVQAPYNSQSYNRYSYVFNNPLSFTDPSGFTCREVSWTTSTDDGASRSGSNWVSAGGSLCGQDAYQYGQIWQNYVYRAQDYMFNMGGYSGAAGYIVIGAANDLLLSNAINTLDDTLNGDYKGAALNAAMVIAKPLKPVEKVVELVDNAKKTEKKAEKALTVKSANGGVRNLPFKDKDRLEEVNKTLDRIESGGPFPYPKKDGSVFENDRNKLPEGNYLEYTVDTPGVTHRAKRRVIQDEVSGRTYYTDDHYDSFIQIDPVRR